MLPPFSNFSCCSCILPHRANPASHNGDNSAVIAPLFLQVTDGCWPRSMSKCEPFRILSCKCSLPLPPRPLGSLSRSSATPIEHVSPCATSPLGIACSHPPTHLERGHELAQMVSTSAGREFTQVFIREWRPIPRRFLTEWSPQAKETRVFP